MLEGWKLSELTAVSSTSQVRRSRTSFPAILHLTMFYFEIYERKSNFYSGLFETFILDFRDRQYNYCVSGCCLSLNWHSGTRHQPLRVIICKVEYKPSTNKASGSIILTHVHVYEVYEHIDCCNGNFSSAFVPFCLYERGNQPPGFKFKVKDVGSLHRVTQSFKLFRLTAIILYPSNTTEKRLFAYLTCWHFVCEVSVCVAFWHKQLSFSWARLRLMLGTII